MIFKKIGVLDPEGKYPNPLNGKPYSKLYSHIAENGEPNLKIFKEKGGWKYYKTYLERNIFFKMLNENQAILVLAGTGVGKTVVIPKLVSHYFDYKLPIITTIPTVKSVESNAKYAAKFLDVQYGMEVACKTGEIDEEHDPGRTKLLFCTDGFVTNKLKSDPLLETYGGIIIDEVHTRNVNIDILLSNVLEIAKVRPEFKIVAMSATVDPKEYEIFFKKAKLKYKLYEIPGIGSKHKVTNIFNTKKITNINDYQGPDMLQKVIDILKNTKTGNILCFVTTSKKGEQKKSELEKYFDSRSNALNEFNNSIPWIGVLHGKTDSNEADICKGDISLDDLSPGKYGKYNRKVIFATNAVEFSVTFKNLDFVIDNGIQWSSYYEPKYNCTVMGAELTAKSNIKQRCGRTGRTGPGTCYRMYTQNDFNKLRDYAIPDILKTDITNELISFLNLERSNTFVKCDQFLNNMLTPISNEAKFHFFNNLLEHNIIGKNGKHTALGKMISQIKLSFDYKLKKMLIASYYFNCHTQIIPLIACLTRINSIDELFINPDTMLVNFKGTKKEKDAEIENKNKKFKTLFTYKW